MLEKRVKMTQFGWNAIKKCAFFDEQLKNVMLLLMGALRTHLGNRLHPIWAYIAANLLVTGGLNCMASLIDASSCLCYNPHPALSLSLSRTQKDHMRSYICKYNNSASDRTISFFHLFADEHPCYLCLCTISLLQAINDLHGYSNTMVTMLILSKECSFMWHRY